MQAQTQVVTDVIGSTPSRRCVQDTGDPLQTAGVIMFRTAVDSTATIESGATTNREWAQPPLISGHSEHSRVPSTDLIARASEIADSLKEADPIDSAVLLVALRGTVSELWETTADCGELHRDCLAILENGVYQAAELGEITNPQLEAIRSAISDLGLSRLTSSHIELQRLQFITAGFGSLGYLTKGDID